MSNFTNGDINTYTVTFFSPLPHFSGDILWFDFPQQIILPSVVDCLPLDALAAIDCTRLSSSAVMAVLTFTEDFNEVNSMVRFQVL
jgi:hypothetical protein